ncbi:MAG TPA: type II toxin-antitoxin system ParD family antitoxin [Solibacterales bacterium]|nr:type II toxin-antitoxin system ParD family antitoxin [Bryobacterales bacterium]
MPLQLSPQQESRIAEALRSGAYQDPNEVIDRALETLREQDEWLLARREAIDTKIRRGVKELERGEGIGEDKLDDYLTRLKAQPE